MANFLDKTGLERFLDNIKNIFALKADTYTKSEVDTLVTDIDLLVPITWTELKALRDNGQLVAGTQYRITDYCTHTDTGDGFMSELYPFDIIVTADSENTLNENARAINHPKKLNTKTIYVEDDNHKTFLYNRSKFDDSENLFGWARFSYENITPEMVPIDWDDIVERVQVSIDIEKLSIGDEFTIEGKNVKLLSMFDEVDHFKNCNLAVWELKYCLDNDKSRFEWAAEKWGKGVIYYMKDEWGNECPYDFKNIKVNHRFNEDGVIVREQDEYIWEDYVYTFCCKANRKDSYSIVDASIFCNDGTLFGNVKDNVIKPYISNGKQKLNNNVFFSYDVGCVFSRNTLSYNCFDNIFNLEAIDNNLGGNCYKNYSHQYFSNNTLADECLQNYFFGEIHYNVLEFNCSGNSLSGECCYNEFGESCSNITLEGVCIYNIFGHCCGEIYILDGGGNQFSDYCLDIHLYEGCHYNTFGHGCYDTTFEDSCDDNRIDNHCTGVYLETDCCYNHISDYCSYILITESSHHNNIGDKCAYIDFEGDSYFYVTVLANTQDQVITGIEPNVSYPQVCGYDENGDYIAKPMLSDVSSTGGDSGNNCKLSIGSVFNKEDVDTEKDSSAIISNIFFNLSCDANTAYAKKDSTYFTISRYNSLRKKYCVLNDEEGGNEILKMYCWAYTSDEPEKRYWTYFYTMYDYDDDVQYLFEENPDIWAIRCPYVTERCNGSWWFDNNYATNLNQLVNNGLVLDDHFSIEDSESIVRCPEHDVDNYFVSMLGKNPIERFCEEYGYSEEDFYETPYSEVKYYFMGWVETKSFTHRGMNVDTGEDWYAYRSFCDDIPIRPIKLADCYVAIHGTLARKITGSIKESWIKFGELDKEDLADIKNLVFKFPYTANEILARLYTQKDQTDYLIRCYDWKNRIEWAYFSGANRRSSDKQIVAVGNEVTSIPIYLRVGICDDHQLKTGNYNGMPTYNTKLLCHCASEVFVKVVN